MKTMFAHLSGRTGRLRRHNSKPLAFGVKRGSKLSNGRYRFWFDTEMPDENYVAMSGARGGVATAECHRAYVDVRVYDLAGAIMQPKTVSVAIYVVN